MVLEHKREWVRGRVINVRNVERLVFLLDQVEEFLVPSIIPGYLREVGSDETSLG